MSRPASAERRPRARQSDARQLWTNWCRFGTDPAQTRARTTGIVAPEGGGTAHPTLGGGYGALGRSDAAARDTAP
jgi:hypothetical protein